VARPALLSVTVLLLVLAGCSGTPVDDGEAPDSVTTPAPVPTDSLPENRIAPGVSQDGIVGPDRLHEAHDTYLDGRSYTRESETVYRFENETVLARDSFARSVDLTETRQQFVRERTFRGSGTFNHTQWSNESISVERFVRNGSVTYERRGRRELAPSSHGGSVAEFIAEQNHRVAGKRSENGTVEYVLVSRNVTDIYLFDRFDTNRTGPTRLVAVVTREGIIRSIELSGEGTYRGEPISVESVFRITAVGETHVGRPPWLDTALNATESQNATWTTG
jgi:hypothetical protein